MLIPVFVFGALTTGVAMCGLGIQTLRFTHRAMLLSWETVWTCNLCSTQCSCNINTSPAALSEYQLIFFIDFCSSLIKTKTNRPEAIVGPMMLSLLSFGDVRMTSFDISLMRTLPGSRDLTYICKSRLVNQLKETGFVRICMFQVIFWLLHLLLIWINKTKSFTVCKLANSCMIRLRISLVTTLQVTKLETQSRCLSVLD